MKKTGRIGWCSTIPRPWCSGRRRRDETPISLPCLDWGSLLTDGMQSGLCPHFIHSPVSEFLNGIHSESWVSTLQYRTMHSECPSIVFKFILKTSCISLVAFFSFCFFFLFFSVVFFSHYQDASVEASVIAPELVQLQWNVNWHFWSIIRDLSWSLCWGEEVGWMLSFTSTFRYLLYCFANYFLLGIDTFSLLPSAWRLFLKSDADASYVLVIKDAICFWQELIKRSQMTESIPVLVVFWLLVCLNFSQRWMNVFSQQLS